VFVLDVYLALKMAKDNQVQVVADFVIINLLSRHLKLLVLEEGFCLYFHKLANMLCKV
jgi:hypothetical protein